MQKPSLKFPTDKAFHVNYIFDILNQHKINPEKLGKNRGETFWDFLNDKCSQLSYPNRPGKGYEGIIEPESIFYIPSTYDTSSDVENFKRKKEEFKKQMINLLPKKDIKDFENKIEKNVFFGPNNYEWVIKPLEIIYNELKDYYVDGKLRIWLSKDLSYDYWTIYDYPHKYNIVGDLDRPNGVYFLSDIEKYIEDKYGIKSSQLYEFIVKNDYIEGRYWEKVLDFQIDEKGKIPRKNGKYGMNAKKQDLLDVLGIIEHEFGSEFKPTDYEGFPIYMDYYKEVKIVWCTVM
mgnify:CR=1 FL=1